MVRSTESAEVRRLPVVSVQADLVVVGGGLAGVCASITAARAGLQVVLVQDRPVLGGNASSEVRLWILGATSHMGNNNRWAREGGVVDEILVENLYRNPEGNPLVLDTILLERVRAEPKITLLLNTAVDEVMKSDASTIAGVSGYCSQNQMRYQISAALFCDASGDGVVGFLSGAAFRMGAESREEFGEKLAPVSASNELLGHSLYFYSKDAGRPVRFVPPEFALQDITAIPRYRDIRSGDSGCRFWWLEWGGRLDTIHQTEEIKWELWRVAYGVWNYIKNSGRFPEAETLTLEWVGTIPGKRESRRFEGDYMLTQQDIVEQRAHPDAVSFGGWAIDLHPAEGVYSELPPCTQWHSKGVYQIPYRCLYSRNIRNLFLTGRLISVSHVAFGSTRVMATCAHNAQAVGMAAALCRENRLLPRDLVDESRMHSLQQRLLRSGQYIPRLQFHDPADLAQSAEISASSSFELRTLPSDGPLLPMDVSRGMLLPVSSGALPAVTFFADVHEACEVRVEVRGSSVAGNYTPDCVLHQQAVQLAPGKQREIRVTPDVGIPHDSYVTYCVHRNASIEMHSSTFRVTGVLSVSHLQNPAVAKGAGQEPPEDSGIDSFEFWIPSRRPGGHNLALALHPPISLFGAENVRNGIGRPTNRSNAWVAAPDDPTPRLSLHWNRELRLRRVELVFDTDFDHPLESVLMGHPERELPFCVQHFRLLGDCMNVLYEQHGNHQTNAHAPLPQPVTTRALHIEVLATHGAPAAIFEVRCYES